MEYRQLGLSGLRVPALSFGTGTFGGQGLLFSAWGQSDAREARRMIATLDAASEVLPPYPHTPYRQQEGFARLAPRVI